MKLLIYGVMRSGTTLVCDLLTVPRRSLMFGEPMIFATWRYRRARELHAVAKAFGIPLGDEPPSEQEFGPIGEYIRQELEPRLSQLDLWGIKETLFYRWPDMIAQFQPDKLILCTRDLRALSALDLTTGSKLAFTGTRMLRDEAWLLSRLTFDLRELLRLRAESQFLLRYEDLVDDPGTPRRLAVYAGLDRLANHAMHRELDLMGTRKREIEKHGRQISPHATSRFERESDALALALSNHIARRHPDHARAFGHSLVGPRLTASDRDVAPFQEFRDRLSPFDAEEYRAAGPAGLDPAFALHPTRGWSSLVVSFQP